MPAVHSVWQSSLKVIFHFVTGAAFLSAMIIRCHLVDLPLRGSAWKVAAVNYHFGEWLVTLNDPVVTMVQC